MMLDTNFLIALQRERRLPASAPRPAHAFLGRHPAEILRISAVVRGEFLEGRQARNAEWIDGTLALLECLPVDEDTAALYARITRDLRAKGRLIGANDLWIAASALRHGETLVSNNRAEFGRIPGLRLAGY